MSLAPGTALQNGHYVIDALLEAAPNGDLYWGTHVITGMQVFIQIFPIATEGSSNDLSGLMARFEGVAFSPQSCLPNPFQLFPGEHQTLCLAMGTAVGLPWSSICQSHPPMTPKQALAAIRQVAASVTWLKSQGIAGLDLSPNRVWMAEGSDRITLTGLPQNHLNLVESASSFPDTSVQFLSRLLYSFLVGEVPTTESAESLRANLHRRLPTLSPRLVQAICVGAAAPANGESGPTLLQWLEQLPDANHPYPATSPNTQLVVRRPQSSSPVRSSSPKLHTALAGTAFFAAIAGITLGTFWRLSAKSLPGAIQFKPEQSFPSQAGWSGDRPDVSFDAPYVPSETNPIREEDWYDSDYEDVPQPEFWESPANAAEWDDYEDNYEPVEVAPEPLEAPPPEPQAGGNVAPGPLPAEEAPVDDVPERESVPQDFTPPPIETPLNQTPF